MNRRATPTDRQRRGLLRRQLSPGKGKNLSPSLGPLPPRTVVSSKREGDFEVLLWWCGLADKESTARASALFCRRTRKDISVVLTELSGSTDLARSLKWL